MSGKCYGTLRSPNIRGGSFRRKWEARDDESSRVGMETKKKWSDQKRAIREVRKKGEGGKKERKRTADLNGYVSAGKCHLFPFQILSRFRIPARLPCLYFTPLRAWQLWWSLRMMKMIVTMRHIMCCYCVVRPLILWAWHISAPYNILIYPHHWTMSVGKSHYIYCKPV